MSNTYVLGQDMSSYTSSTEKRYMYALRKDDDGTFYVARLDTHDVNDSIEMFGAIIPLDFEDLTFPPTVDYHNNRNATTKVLTYDRQDVKYEQWRMDNRLLTYYLDTDGNFVVSIGQDKQLPETVPGKLIGDASGDFVLNITNDMLDVKIRQYLLNRGWNSSQAVVINIISGASVASNNPAYAAIEISGSYPGGITINNYGDIIGASAFTLPDGSYVNAGNAIDVTTADSCIIINNGTIAGGNSFSGSASDGYGINGIDNVTLTNNGTINSTN